MAIEETKAKRAAYARAWRERHRDRYLAADKERRKGPSYVAKRKARAALQLNERARRSKEKYHSDPAFKEQRKAAANSWASKNKEKAKAKAKRDRLGKFGKEYERSKYAKNPTPKREAVKRWYLNNKDAAKATALRYRARKKGALGRILKDDFTKLRSVLGGLCLKCGADKNIQWDHVSPLSVGGHNGPTNLQPLCNSCNPSKGKGFV